MTCAIRNSRNAQRKINTTCTSSAPGSWGVSGTTGTGIKGYVLNVYRFPRERGLKMGTMARAEIDGKLFADDEAATAAALDAGFLHFYCRNLCDFTSNRTYRRRTGRLAHNETYYVFRHRRQEWSTYRIHWHQGRKMLFDARRRWINCPLLPPEAAPIVAALQLTTVIDRYFPDYYASPELFATMRPTRQPTAA